MTEIEVLDPATVRPIAAVEDMDETTVDAAVRRARAAFDNDGGWWPGTPDEERGRVLARAAERVRAQADQLARLESLDVGTSTSTTGERRCLVAGRRRHRAPVRKSGRFVPTADQFLPSELIR